MKYIISEKQLANIIIKQKEIDEQSDTTTSNSSTSSGENNKSVGSADYPPYPETGKWVSGIQRGPANQIATNSKWSDVVGSKLTRGHANPLK